MPSSCYRCGAPVEEQTAFCASCGAPLIRVAVPSPPANESSTQPLPPGTPDSIQPPAVPVSFAPSGEIQWRTYQRIAVPLSILSGVAIAFVAPLGLLLFFAAIVYAVSRYRRGHDRPLSSGQGARLGAFSGFITFVVVAVIQAALNHAEIRQQLLQEIHRRYAGNPDPQLQRALQWLGTTQGFAIFMILSLLFFLFVFIVLSSLAGALTVTLFSDRDRR